MTVQRGQPGSRHSTRGTARKETRRLLAEIVAAGGTVEQSRANSHWKVYFQGRHIGNVVGTPGDRRSWQNDIARLRRNGLPIDTKGHHHEPDPE